MIKIHLESVRYLSLKRAIKSFLNRFSGTCSGYEKREPLFIRALDGGRKLVGLLGESLLLLLEQRSTPSCRSNPDADRSEPLSTCGEIINPFSREL